MQSFYNGHAFDAYTYFGAHPGPGGVTFRTYAPAARRVEVIGQWNDWNGEEMPRTGTGGVFELACPGAKAGQMYKYRITGAGGDVVDHCDPYGFGMELRPASASVIVQLSGFTFSDEKWMEERDKCYNKPMNIYELHLGSWRENALDENGWFHFEEIADELVAYLKENHFTHVEFMPLSEYPADESWGYQPTGFFAPTARYGTAHGLMQLIDKLHAGGIGAFIDFVPVHFALDGYALNSYDGTQLYEYPHSDVGVSEWGSLNFIHSRREVCCFLQSAANYWLTEYHFDGIRMDAISRCIYWQGDPARGVNPNAVNFIKTMNSGLHRLHPTAILMAEDSTAYAKITAPVEYDGLGFDYKWDLGWMHDTLNYFKTPPAERPAHHHKLTFSMQYFYNELFLLPLSHDEVVHGKATIIQKMWGDYEQKFPQARALYLYMMAHPGKKLNFMGSEIAQFREWDEARQQDWDILTYPLHDAFHRYFARLCEVYKEYPALHVGEYDPACFTWLEADACAASVYIFQRQSGAQRVAAVLNLSDRPAQNFLCTVAAPQSWTEIISSDWDVWGGGSVKKNQTTKAKQNAQTKAWQMQLDIPPFTGQLFLVEEAPPKAKMKARAK